MNSVEATPEAFAQDDCIVIVTDHKAFDYRAMVQRADVIVDTRNAVKFAAPNVFKLGAPQPDRRQRRRRTEPGRSGITADEKPHHLAPDEVEARQRAGGHRPAGAVRLRPRLGPPLHGFGADGGVSASLKDLNGPRNCASKRVV